jgi:hypothetical protein
VNTKRVCRIMKAHTLLLDWYNVSGEESRHPGRIAVGRSDKEVVRTSSRSAAAMARKCAFRSPWSAATASDLMAGR